MERQMLLDDFLDLPVPVIIVTLAAVLAATWLASMGLADLWRFVFGRKVGR